MCLILCSVLFGRLSAQSEPIPLPRIVAADDSLLSLERSVMTATDFDQRWWSLKAKAFYLAEQGNTIQASAEVERILEKRPYSALSAECLYYLGYFDLLEGDLGGTQIAIYYLDRSERQATIELPYHLLSSLAAIQDHRLDDARAQLFIHLRETLQMDSVASDSTINALLPTKLERKIKRERTAKRLSLIPGLGQLYAGKPFSALVSAALIGTMGVYAGFSVYQGYYATAVLTGGFGFLTLLNGGSKNATYLAIQHNQQLSRRLMEQLLTAVPLSNP